MYQLEAEPPPGKVAFTPVTWAPDGRARRAQGDGPQLVLGVTATPACHFNVSFSNEIYTEEGSITP